MKITNVTASNNSSYNVVLTDSGKWLNAPGSDFLFAFLMDDWTDDVKTKVTDAFEDALGMSSIIKTAVKETAGQEVENGLYLLDQSDMTKAMNSIPGMGETSADQKENSGNGTAFEITQEFFATILAGLGGDVTPLMNYLTPQMGTLQGQTKQSTVTENFGTVIGLVSLMPVLNVPVTTFQYVYSSATVSIWFVHVNCGSAERQSYHYSYTVVNYNYKKP